MEKLKVLRKERKISQEKLAGELGVSRSTIAMWETGGSQPDNAALRALADYFGTTTDYLLDHELETGESPVGFDDFTYAMYNESRELSPESREKLLEMARYFKQLQSRDIDE